ncbi:ATP-binding protein [Terrihalobacillus insolitus]|uniref:ATP-binding protein n=1 Tax=Terrihalobacillus insolitus TaxID=2950438 RepID=UPI002341AC06|nr:ATP-binding protein [Terrihalobacillus insolitus]MDC3413535.1 hypothetical protein [Terrihalobacillus insolitus]
MVSGGSSSQQLDNAYEYLHLQNKVEAKFEGLKRIEKTEYPHYALREALINAVVHRDYSHSGSILIHIFEDRMEIVSVGGLVNGLTMNDILIGVSESRNKKLAACFYRLKLIESFGTGIQRIKESYKSESVFPEFKSSENAFLVTLPNSVYVRETVTTEERIIFILKHKGLQARREIEQELDLSKSSVTKLLNKLLSEGKIKQQGKARNTKYYVD